MNMNDLKYYNTKYTPRSAACETAAAQGGCSDLFSDDQAITRKYRSRQSALLW